MQYRIFIGWDSRFQAPGRVMAHSLRQHTTAPLDIRFLDLRHLRECYGFSPKADPKASTEFTYSRFLVPWLCGYSGRALFVDNDMVCHHDITQLFRDYHPRMEKAIHVVQHDYRPKDGVKMYGAAQSAYPRKNWSSVMLMDCDKLRCWSKDVVEEANGARLHRFQDIPDALIGSLDPKWNRLESQDGVAAIRHWTEGGPWYAEYRSCSFANEWYDAAAAAGEPL